MNAGIIAGITFVFTNFRDEELASCFTSDTPILDKTQAATWCAEQVSTYITGPDFSGLNSLRFRSTLTANVLETACP